MIEGNVVYEAFKISFMYLYSGKVKAPMLEICICVDHSFKDNASWSAIDFVVEFIYVAHIYQIPLIFSLSEVISNFFLGQM